MSVVVRDNGSPSLSATQSFTVTVLKTNNPPVFAPMTNSYVAQVLLPLKVTNVVTDPDVPTTNQFTFGIVAGPKGVRINRFTGVVIWVPAKEEARSVNLISVSATDDGLPPLSATNSFQVTVDDYLELILGSLVLRAGQTGSVPLTVTNSSGVTNLSAFLYAPPNQLTNLALSALASELRSGTLTPQGPGLSKLSFSTTNGQILQPGQVLAHLNFTAISNQPSAFVPLLISNVISFQTNGLPLTRTLANAGRAVVVGSQPLLEAAASTNPEPALTLYGQTGSNYLVQAALSPVGQPSRWQFFWQDTLTNLSQALPPPTNASFLFFRSLRP